MWRLWRLERVGVIELAEVEQSLLVKETSPNPGYEEVTDIEETTAETVPSTKEDTYDPMSWIEEEEDSESICCDHIRISSEGKVRAMYPHILGDYQYYDPLYYIKPGSTKPLYLTQPKATGHVWGYTWGVTLSLEARWGYIRSGYSAPCPTMAGQWKVYDKVSKGSVPDTGHHSTGGL